MADAEDTLKQAERELGRKIPDGIRGYLIEGGFVDEYRFDDLIIEIQALLKAWEKDKNSNNQQTERKEIPPDNRHVALARIVVAQARRNPEVQKFRKEVMGVPPNKLLEQDQVDNWIKRKAKKDGDPTGHEPMKAKVRNMKTGKMEERTAWVQKLEYRTLPEMSFLPNPHILQYAVPWSADFPVAGRQIPINVNGVLGRLKRIVYELLLFYPGWKEQDATTFVLTNKIPPIIRGDILSVEHGSLPALSRIHMKLDPYLSPREVADIYKDTRQSLWRENRKRYRQMEDKTLELAVFAEGHCREEQGPTWKELRQRWNELPETKKRKWQYRENQGQYFARDVKSAWERVTGREFRRIKGEGKK